MKNRVRDIGYCDRTGAPAGIVREFMAVIIEFPGCGYGKWWYIQSDGTASRIQGWYIWVESQKKLGVTRRANTVWATVDSFEAGLIALANTLLS